MVFGTLIRVFGIICQTDLMQWFTWKRWHRS